MAEHIREILIQEQEHLIDLATALGENPPRRRPRREEIAGGHRPAPLARSRVL